MQEFLRQLSDTECEPAMDDDQPKLISTASLMVIFPIVAMMGGLVFGIISGLKQRPIDELAGLRHAIEFAIWGFFLGLGFVVLISVNGRNIIGATSTKRMIVLVAVAALLCWFLLKVLMQAMGS